MNWIEFRESLFEEGYKCKPCGSADSRAIRGTKCPDCGRKALFPRAFTNPNKEHVLYQKCSWCDYYGEV